MIERSIVNIELMKEFDLLKDLPGNAIQMVIDKLHIKNIPENTVIFYEGEQGDSIVFLLDGRISISQAMTLPTDKSEEDTREKEVFNTTADMRPVFGEIGLFGRSGKRTANVKAVTNCTIAKLYRDDFFAVCEHNTEIGFQLLKNIAHILSGRLVESNKNIMKLTTALSLILDK